MQRKFEKAFHIPGTGVDMNIYWLVPSDCQLVHVSAVASNATNGTFTVGISTDTDEYLTASAIGDSLAPNEFEGGDFVDADGNTHTRFYPHITDGLIMCVVVDTDGGVSGTADDVTIVLTFVEG
jgi:hypothetical protein